MSQLFFKKGDPSFKRNYRPISVLATLSRIYERNMGVQINNYINGILSPLLSGFRQGYSTQHALFYGTKTWRRCLDINGTAGTILIDFSKASDCVVKVNIVAQAIVPHFLLIRSFNHILQKYVHPPVRNQHNNTKKQPTSS